MDHKIVINEEIGQALKAFRMQYKVKAKDVASILEKSPAYISKLEKGQIQQVDKNDFVRITNYIANDSDGYDKFCNIVIKNSDIDALDRSVFLRNFDLIERKLPVPDDLVKSIAALMIELKVSPEELSEYINRNEDLDDAFFEEHKIDKKSIKKNVWHIYFEADSSNYVRSYIFLNYSAERIHALLDGKIKKCDYTFLYAIVYHLIKLKKKCDNLNFDEKLCGTCKNEAEQLLLKYKFYSLSLQERIRIQSKTENEYREILSDFDIDNAKYVEHIVRKIHFLSQLDVDYTNSKLETIVKNMDELEDTFVLAFMATSLDALKETSISMKKDFLKDIKSIVKRYSEKSIDNKSIEKY